jgi:hypothetical protein
VNPAELARLIEAVVAGGVKVPFVMHEAVADLPPGVPRSTAGLYVNNHVRLVAENLANLAEAEGVIAHELGHAGVDILFNDPIEREMALREVVSKNAKLIEVAKQWREAYGADFIKSRMDRGMTKPQAERALSVESMEEAIMYLAQERIPFKGLKPLLAKIQRTLRKRGFVRIANWLENATDAEALEFIRRLHQATIDGGRGVRGTPAYHLAYHGSPHDHDKFDLSYLGTGEGERVYGWGLYFAGRKAVAEWYRDVLAKHAPLAFFRMDSDKELVSTVDMAEAYFKKGTIVNGYGGRDKVIDFQREVKGAPWAWNVQVARVDSDGKVIEPPRWHATFPDTKELKRVLFVEGWSQKKGGKLYEVELAPPEAHYLDWDKPLGKQTAYVQAAIANIPDLGIDFNDNALTGRGLYHSLENEARMGWYWSRDPAYKGMAHDQAASMYLRNMGIPGIKYLDNVSRGLVAVRNADPALLAAAENIATETRDYDQVMDRMRKAYPKVSLSEIANAVEEALGHPQATHNYVIFDDADVSIVAKYSRAGFKPFISTNTPAFKRWFRKSKVVDKNGKPLVVYHGTERAGFSSFDGSRAGEVAGRRIDGIYFTDHVWGAKTYSGPERAANIGVDEEQFAPGIYAAYLSMQKPKVVDFKGAGWDGSLPDGGHDPARHIDSIVRKAKAAGFDGVIAKNIMDEGKHGDGYGFGENTYVVFEPTQIKSATDNAGTFDPTNPDIRYSRREFDFNRALRRGDVLEATPREAEISDRVQAIRSELGKRWDDMVKAKMAELRVELKVDAPDSPLKAVDEENITGLLRQIAHNRLDGNALVNDPSYQKLLKEKTSLEEERIGLIMARTGPPEFDSVQQLVDHPRRQAKSRAFRRWFEGSVVVDDQGRPLIVLHGTDANITEFKTVSSKAGKTEAFNNNWLGELGSWFAAPIADGRREYETGSAEMTAEVFADIGGSRRRRESGGVIYPVYLSIKNPYEAYDYQELVEERADAGGPKKFREKLIAQGYDGVVIRNSNTDGGQERDDWVAFYPEQIKSAIGNSGAFDPNNPDIR